MAILSTPTLLARWRADIAAGGAGPDAPLRMVERNLRGEKTEGRLAEHVDPHAVAVLLCGAAMQQAVLAHIAGNDGLQQSDELYAALVAAIEISESAVR